ncbi:MAG: hypothetical protein Q8P85_03890 [Pseudomonas sp.]|nr:hypothetical protein [Pseudomonas sp.]
MGGVVEDFEEHAFQRHRRFYRQQVAAGLVELGDEGRQRGLDQFTLELAVIESKANTSDPEVSFTVTQTISTNPIRSSARLSRSCTAEVVSACRTAWLELLPRASRTIFRG